MRAWWWLCLFTSLALGPSGVQAANLGCSITSVSGVSLTYSPGSSTDLVASGTVTINCVKNGNNNDTRYLEVGASAGLQPAGSQNQAANGSSRLAYSLMRDSALSAPWGDASGQRLSTTVSSTTSTTLTLPWWMVVRASQLASAGTYLDTVTVRLYQDSKPNPALSDPSPQITTLSVALQVNSACSISSAPAAMNFSYTSFQTVTATASSSFAVTCTQGAPYTVALDTTSGRLLGLDYQLSMNVSGTRTGTGAAQAIVIQGSIAAGQSGTCASGSCSASEMRTVTISY